MDIEICSNCNEIIQFRNRKSNYKTIDMDESNNYLFCRKCRVKKGNSNKYGYTRKSIEIFDENEDD